MGVFTFNLEVQMDALVDRLQSSRPSNLFPDPSLRRALNLGAIQLSRRTKVVNTLKFLYLSAGINRYTCPDNWLRGQNNQVLYLQNGALSGYQYPLKKMGRRGMQSVMADMQQGVLSAGTYNQPGSGYPKAYLLDGNVIEFVPIPDSNAAGSKRICFKFPGMPDSVSATSATMTDVPLEYRELVVTYAEHLMQLRMKDKRAPQTLAYFISECERINSEVKWGDQEEPPCMQPEEYYQSGEYSIY